MIVVATTEAALAGVRDRLAELGSATVDVLDPGGERRLVRATADDDRHEARVVAAMRADGTIAVTRPDRGVRLDAWMRHTRPITFGDRFGVCFAWSEHDRADVAGMVEIGLGGFGNGDHPSTRLVVEALLERVGGGERVLDVGCGSGVLGLAALRLGAAQVVAVDLKPEAVAATRQNAALNDVASRIEASTEPLTALEGGFDVVVANVGRAAVVEMASDLVACLAPGGWLAVSGFSARQCSLVGGFLRPLAELDRRIEDDWGMVVVGRFVGG